MILLAVEFTAIWGDGPRDQMDRWPVTGRPY